MESWESSFLEPPGHSPVSPALGDPAWTRGVGLDDLQVLSNADHAGIVCLSRRCSHGIQKAAGRLWLQGLLGLHDAADGVRRLPVQRPCAEDAPAPPPAGEHARA